MKSTSQLVDALGAIKAKIADLTAAEKEIKEQLVNRAKIGIDESRSFEGAQYRATINRALHGRLDMEAVRAKLSNAFIRNHTYNSEVVSVRVVARVRDQSKEVA